MQAEALNVLLQRSSLSVLQRYTMRRTASCCPFGLTPKIHVHRHESNQPTDWRRIEVVDALHTHERGNKCSVSYWILERCLTKHYCGNLRIYLKYTDTWVLFPGSDLTGLNIKILKILQVILMCSQVGRNCRILSFSTLPCFHILPCTVWILWCFILAHCSALVWSNLSCFTYFPALPSFYDAFQP